MSLDEFLSQNGIEISQAKDASGEDVWAIKKEDLFRVSEFLKNDKIFSFDILLAVTGLDCVSNFEVLYHLFSTRNNKRLILKVALDKDSPSAESLCGLYNSANWHERECFDLLGLEFIAHPKLERILLPKDWIGYPLRKDYKEEDERLSWNRR